MIQKQGEEEEQANDHPPAGGGISFVPRDLTATTNLGN